MIADDAGWYWLHICSFWHFFFFVFLVCFFISLFFGSILRLHDRAQISCCCGCETFSQDTGFQNDDDDDVDDDDKISSDDR